LRSSVAREPPRPLNGIPLFPEDGAAMAVVIEHFDQL
jgi:hypothetical protein